MSRFYKYGSQDVLCPFYRGHDAQSIVCEGLWDDSVIELRFKRRTETDSVLGDFCCSRCYEGCVIYQAVRERYEE